MADVKSKNLFDLLGNTSDGDSDADPGPPTKTVDKPVARSGKRDEPKAAPAEPTSTRGARGPRRAGFSSNDEAFRDRATGRNYNRSQPTEGEDGARPTRGDRDGPGRAGRGRGGRGRGGRGGDRRDRTGQTEHIKQSDAAWGAPTGEGEYADEKAGDAIATQEAKGGWDTEKSEGWDANNAAPATEGKWDAGEENSAWKNESSAPTGDDGAPEPEAEPEDNHKSYADYLTEKAANKMKDLGLKEARAPNEGSKDNKKWKGAKELSKEDEEDSYFQGKEDKARRERDRTRNAKERVEFTFNVADPESGRGGGGRGRGRGRGERGEYRGRGERGERGEFRGRGRGDRDRERDGEGFRGGRGRGDRDRDRSDRGDFRGRGRGRGRSEGSAQTGSTTTVAVDDESAFPSLGGSK